MASPVFRTLRDGVLGLAYPLACRICRCPVQSWDDGVVCAECWDDPALTPIIRTVVCDRCGAPLTPSTGKDSSPDNPGVRLCGMCPAAAFTTARACGIYRGAFEASVLFLKITPHICPRLQAIIERTFRDHLVSLRSEVVVPVPLHPLREQSRGFNQAAIIGRVISRRSGLDIDERSLLRTKATGRHRAGMDSSDRAKSVEGAFEVVRPRLIECASVLLVDDVYTTGSTIRAASQALIDGGARRVNVLTIARVGSNKALTH